ncbi:hypothetical protein E8E11_003021 [Didymella keratinophila]|nr:hypothetical protein E8E11_003021 [Didymella keratinophila]
MSRQRGARPSRGERHETPLQVLQKDVQRLGLQDVLGSLPTPDSFHFNKASKNGHGTTTLFLGNRPNPNGSTSQAWARIVSRAERKDFQPPLLFYDQELRGTRTIQYPRSASSLLRKATLLLPPFCFLQHDPIDEATNVREMLSAIILYLAAATDVDASAWRWDKFSDSLIQALRYIDSRGAYHEWRHLQKLAALAQTDPVQAAKEMQDELGQETDAGQHSDAAIEVSNTVSATPNGRYLGGTVRSRGSDIAITPNTSLERLKSVLGDRKFKMLDHIPPKPMTISRHDVGGSLFPFRMFVGTAAYEETREVIDVYAYIDREEGKTAMYFMSHDKTGLSQIYDVNDMREGVDLVQPFEYLNNLKKASYKNDAKSARAAKLRSLVSYHFFLAENQGLIGDPGIDVHEAFGKRLCAVCKELGMEQWGNDDDGGSEEYQDKHRKDTEIDRETQVPAIIDTEGLPEGGANTESSRSSKLRMRSDVLNDVARSTSVEQNEEMPDQDSSTDQARRPNIEDTTTLELELHPSSQIAQANPPGPSDSPGDLMDIDDEPDEIEPAGADLRNEQTMHSRSPQPGAALRVSGNETSNPPSAHLVSTANEGATDLVKKRREDEFMDGGMDPDHLIYKSIRYLRSVGSRHGEYDASAPDTAEDDEISAEDSFDWAPFGREACFPSNKRPPMTGFLFGPLSVQRKTTTKAKSRVPQSNDVQVEGRSEHVSSPPAPTPKASRASSKDAKNAITAWINNGLQLNGSVRHLLGAQIGGNRPPTPEGSAERDLKSQAGPTETARTASQATSAFEAIIISDDEDEYLALTAPRSVIDRTLEARNRVRETLVDLTQLSSSPRRKKRKSLGPFYLSDSEKDLISETDGSEWRRKSRGRQK